MIVGTYGHIVFLTSTQYIRTFSNFKRSSGERYAKHDVMGAKPVNEHIGPELDQISFSMRLDASLGLLPLLSLSALRTIRGAAEVNPLIIGTSYLGNYLITNISEEWRYFGATGTPRVIIVEINLIEDSQGSLRETIVKFGDDFINAGGDLING
ncbi:phage tail protein [Serratia quinivorans]|uniref:phage tail protein n=1 Tax=Serratia quinivorans TaxID=137545 RepID=UPI0021781ED4|nr:phage tail protein [Serratia quinivorans]CAI1645505.1 Phage protein U [Serratia quinivorans]CAI1725610.1 Phage protein U [Serratia quinivorans]